MSFTPLSSSAFGTCIMLFEGGRLVSVLSCSERSSTQMCGPTITNTKIARNTIRPNMASGRWVKLLTIARIGV